MKSNRLAPLIRLLTQDTVLGELLVPAINALDYSRAHFAIFRAISMGDFITLGVLRHLKGTQSLRALVQELAHEVDEVEHPPMARSTWGDALGSRPRLNVLRDVRDSLLSAVARSCPDRLSGIDGLGTRAVYAMDGSYQKESAHYARKTPAEGGEDNDKGHCLLSFYDVRMGCVADVAVETRSRHEIPIMKDYDKTGGALTQVKGALWVVDRAFIDAQFWDAKKRKLGVTMITRMKSNLSIDSNEHREVAKRGCNEGVVSDQQITLKSSGEFWRLIRYRSRRGGEVEFLSNDMVLEPGVIAFAYARRWDEEKAFDVWKNDWSMGKAWGKSQISITNQVMLAVITQLLLALFLAKHDCGGDADKKSLDKQAQREGGTDGGTDRAKWTQEIYRHTSRLSRQVLRFFRYCYAKRASSWLYEHQLRPLLMRYL
ncbi:MAG: transposase [Gammaproteobacteria bacterium]|nr:transposase [Gammaproteobacteria bacterium]